LRLPASEALSEPFCSHPADDATSADRGGLDLSHVTRTSFCVLCAAIAACDVGFVETQPPRLKQFSASFTAQSAPDPIVFGLVVDFEVPDADGCAAALSWMEQTVASALPQGAPVVRLPDQRISGDSCQVTQSQTLDPKPIAAAVQSARARFPQANLRPLIFFATNLSLPLQTGVLQGLSQLSAISLPPVIWSLAPQAAASSFNFQQSLAWTFTQDPNLAAQLQAALSAVLPFQSAPAQSQAVALPAADVAGITLMKLCSTAQSAGAVETSSTPAFNGSAAVSLGGAVPVFNFTSPAIVAVPRTGFAVPSVTVALEGCSTDCHHLFDGNDDGPGISWDTAARCSDGKVTQ
jgi:hypothetical protein